MDDIRAAGYGGEVIVANDLDTVIVGSGGRVDAPDIYR